MIKKFMILFWSVYSLWMMYKQATAGSVALQTYYIVAVFGGLTLATLNLILLKITERDTDADTGGRIMQEGESSAHGHVKCDKCDWKIEVANIRDIREWHGKACPKCGAPDVVDDRDREALERVIKLWDKLDALGLAAKPGQRVRSSISVDSTPLREGKPLDIKVTDL